MQCLVPIVKWLFAPSPSFWGDHTRQPLHLRLCCRPQKCWFCDTRHQLQWYVAHALSRRVSRRFVVMSSCVGVFSAPKSICSLTRTYTFCMHAPLPKVSLSRLVCDRALHPRSSPAATAATVGLSPKLARGPLHSKLMPMPRHVSAACAYTCISLRVYTCLGVPHYFVNHLLAAIQESQSWSRSQAKASAHYSVSFHAVRAASPDATATPSGSATATVTVTGVKDSSLAVPPPRLSELHTGMLGHVWFCYFRVSFTLLGCGGTVHLRKVAYSAMCQQFSPNVGPRECARSVWPSSRIYFRVSFHSGQWHHHSILVSIRSSK